MNNGRDCVHGRQVGKCDTCELIDADQRILELEAEVELLREAEAYFKNGMAELQDYIDKMDPELLALRSQVEQLRSDMNEILGTSTKNAYLLRLMAKQSLRKTPPQCLAEIKAQAGRDGYAVGWQACMDYQSKGVCLWEAEYANQLRQQAKEES